MRKLLLTHPLGSSAEIFLNGAQVTSWVPASGGERLFLSGKAVFGHGQPIRGGIPVVFPQFADSGPLPKHGWLRTTHWVVQSQEGEGSVTLRTEETRTSRALWPHTYEVRLRVTLEAEALEATLIVRNPGAEAFGFTSALHTYLAVSDISQAEVRGLYGSPYIDKTSNRAVVHDGEPALKISRETDRIYTDAPRSVDLVDGESTLRISASGFPDVVLWNPWADLARDIADMRDDDYTRFLCVEAAAAVTPIILRPGETWEGSQRLELMR